MSNCGQTKPGNSASTREIVQGLFAAGKDKAAFAHRLNACLHASKCGRLCPRLVKSPGVALVYCTDIATGEATPLYDAIADAAFTCPEGRF